MNFKDQIKNDIDIFLNIDEFAEEILIGKKKYRGILTNPANEDPKNEYEGVYNEVDLKLYLVYDDSLKKYTTGKEMIVNEKYYSIHRTFNEEGIFIAELNERSRF